MKIHRYWQGDPHPLADWVRVAVRTTHPGHALACWGPDDLLEVDQAATDDPRHAANLLRYAVLHEHGGLWLDHDLVPFRDLTTLHDEPWVASLDGRFVGCAMFFPEPGHPVLAELLARAREADPALPSARRSGGYLLNEVLDGYRLLMEPRVLPFDARGRATGVDPVALHTWDSSSRRFATA